MLNRIAPGVLAVCLVAGLRPDMVMGSGAPRPSAAPTTSAVTLPNTVQPSYTTAPSRLGSAIDEATAAEAGVSSDVLNLALAATSCAASSGAIDAPPTLTVIDYSRPSVEPRLWVFDLATGDLLFELVAHGRNTGENLAIKFSNEMESRQTSLGLFVTDDTYIGSNGYSLRLDGLDVGFNDRARDRAGRPEVGFLLSN